MSSRLTLQLFTVDSFSDKPFSGNPAAVCIDSIKHGLDEDIMQKIASEMNISETAFVYVKDIGKTSKTASHFGLRWFTPKNEVPLCGHGTLAASAVLFNCLENVNECLTFDTLSGPLMARRKGELISLDLPINTPQPLEAALGVLIITSGLVQEIQYSEVTRKLLVRLKDSFTRQELEQLTPNIDQMMAAHNTGKFKGVILTVKAKNSDKTSEGKPYDFLSRYFAPWVGIPEDPVTGSAHSVLAPYWSRQLNKSCMIARQCSARGGDLYINVRDDGRVDIAGPATVVLKGEITI